jgi:fluoride exporter
MSALSYVVVFVGAGIGGALRHAVNRLALSISATFPWGTLAVNVTGCLIMGMLVGWLSLKGESSQTTRLFLTTGILGGYTTFSAFSLDAALLWERGQIGEAVFYVASSVVLSIACLFLGLALMRP